MKNFNNFGVKVRSFPEYNYHAVWANLKTLRLGIGQAKQLPADKSEFYDVSLGTKCNLQCPFCYVGATTNGRNYTNLVDKANFFFGNMSENDKPFQIACGSESEPLVNPECLDFFETVYKLGIVPNYTTNGICIAKDDEWSEKILDTTRNYVGGVALSANTWNKQINETWRKAFKKLIDFGETKINLHYIIKDSKSVDEFISIYDEFKDDTYYFVLLPLMNHGRSNETYSDDAFNKLIQKIGLDWSKIAFGANFYHNLLTQDKIKCWLYPPESFSKNLILDDIIKITPSSFNLTSIKEIKYERNNCDL